jgi:hypothetical protein
MVERSDQWLLPLDQTVTMLALDGAPACSQYLAPASSGVVVAKTVR